MEPQKIKKLDINVVNRIAAGEIIQRPVNALKELLENSLDAKSKSIQITVKSGGLKYLQIQDNGTGIRYDDLTIVCERFTTSKLEKFEDLSQIATYGFRGEALASISHIAHLTIQTKTCNDKCAYKATYKDGKLKESPKPCAGNQGTTITVEDLFFNLPQRLKTVKSPNEEFQKISNLVSKYAIHNSNVSIMLRKIGENVVFRTPLNGTKIENVKIIYGNEIAKRLLEIEHHDKNLNFNMIALITDANYSSAKKSIFLIFVNHRLVESNALKIVIEEIYSNYLPKGQHPFIYISLELNPSTVDVNVHPTKHEVKFLNEEEIINSVKEQIEMKLNGSENAKLFYTESRLSGVNTKIKEKKEKLNDSSNSDRINPTEFIRTDNKEQKLEKFLILPHDDVKPKLNHNGENSFTQSLSSGKRNETVRKKITQLTSILNMRKNIETLCSNQLKQIMKEMVFVGVVNKQYSLLQFETKLYLCDTIAYSCELFYQRLIYNFENFDKITFKNPLKIEELAMIALDCEESGWTEDDGPKELLADRVLQILSNKKAIMKEYFGLNINNNGELESLPILIENHKPSMCFLPIYILRLATEVEWDNEDECFETFCRETADYYSRVPDHEELNKNHKWTIEHAIYPALRNYLKPNNQLKNNLFELANLLNLYKVFERC